MLAQPLQALLTMAVDKCHTDFFLLPTWYKYLSLDPSSCAVVNLELPGDLILILLAVIDIAMRIVGLVAVGYVIYGGIQYQTSQGEPARVKNALGTIINAFIGLAIALLSASFVAFIGNRLG